LLNVTGMTFAEQARMFMNARLIVAPTGAALATMIFAPEGCRVIVMSATYDGATYEYFHWIAHLLGHRLTFVVGPQVENIDYHMNRDYVIDINDLKLALEDAGGLLPSERALATPVRAAETLLPTS